MENIALCWEVQKKEDKMLCFGRDTKCRILKFDLSLRSIYLKSRPSRVLQLVVQKPAAFWKTVCR